MKKNIYSRMDFLKERVIVMLSLQGDLAYDQAKKIFEKSVTCQLLYQTETNFYLLNDQQIWLLLQKEKNLMENFELNSRFKKTNNKIVDSILEEIKRNLLVESLVEDLSIEEIYKRYFNLSKKKVRKIKLNLSIKSRHKKTFI